MLQQIKANIPVQDRLGSMKFRISLPTCDHLANPKNGFPREMIGAPVKTCSSLIFWKSSLYSSEPSCRSKAACEAYLHECRSAFRPRLNDREQRHTNLSYIRNLIPPSVVSSSYTLNWRVSGSLSSIHWIEVLRISRSYTRIR